MRRIKMVIMACAGLAAGSGLAPMTGAGAQQDLQDTLGRVLQGFQGGQDPQRDPQQDPRGPQRRGDDRRVDTGDRADPRDRMRALDEADRRLDAQQRQIDEDRRRIEAERRRLAR